MSHWQMSPNVLSTNVHEEAVLLNPEAGEYFGLNPIATLIWGELHAPQSVERLTAIICKNYLVTPDEASGDVKELLQEMHAKGLVVQHG